MEEKDIIMEDKELNEQESDGGSFCRNLLDAKSSLDVGLLGSSGFRLSL